MLATDRAMGHWPEILSAAGVPDQYLSKKHGPCPFCGGNDRYRFADKGKGLWVCSQCTADTYKSGMDFLLSMSELGLRSFTDAAAHVHKYFDGSGGVRAAMKPAYVPDDDGAKRAYRLKKMRELLGQTREVQVGDPVWHYLMNRVPGLQSVPSGIRCHPALEYYEQMPRGEAVPYRLLGKFPAMIVPGLNAQGELVQVHKTYLTVDGKKAPVPSPKKTDVGVGSNAYSLRMMDFQEGDLGVSEGIETGLAGSLIYGGIPVWPCHCASVMGNFEVPEEIRAKVRRLIIFMDNDAPKVRRDGTLWRAGREAAAEVSARARKHGIRTLIVKAPKTGADIADLLEEMAA